MTGAEVVDESQAQPTPDTSLKDDAQNSSPPPTTDDTLLHSLSTLDVPSDRRELVFIDTSVENYQVLIEGINANAEVILLDTTRDGIEHIADILQNRRDIDAIHLISHGDQGELRLGTGALTLESMQNEYADELSVIGQALGTEADVLIYGCNFGEGEAGQAAAARLAQLTGADVAASNDLTGSAGLGGDWDLEVATGHIETGIAVAETAQATWANVLDITSNLVAHYAFDEGAGTTATDSTANNNDGTHQNSPSHVAGHIGSGALDFSGDAGSNNKYVTVPDDPSLDISGDFSVTFWYNSTTTHGSQVRLVGARDAGQGFVVYTDSSNSLNLWVVGSSTDVTVFDSGGHITDGQWHHVTITRIGNTFRTYVDGAETDFSTAAIGTVSTTSPLTFGATNATSNDYEGKLDDIRLYTRGLSAADVTELYNYTGNAAPAIADLGSDALAYTEGDGAVVIDQGASAAVTDADSADFDTGTLTVSFTAGSDTAEDVLAIRDQGAGATNITVSGNAVSYGGTQIGTFTGGSSGTNLVITLDADADATAVSALVQNITYENTDTNAPTTGARTVRYVLTDGDGGTSANYDTTVTVSAANDAPVLTPNTPALTTITEDDTGNSGNLISAIVGASITDADSSAVEGMAITALNSSNGTWQYNTGSGWTTVGAVTNTSALLLRATDSLRFVPDGQNADTASVTYRAWDQTSGAAGTKVDTSTNGGTTAFSTATDTASLTVTAVNDAPVIGDLGSDILFYTEGNGAQVIDQSTNAAVTDVDSSNFDTGTLTVSFNTGSDTAEDVLGIRDQGAGATNITVAGNAVSYGGTQIGTFTGGSGGTNLVITLDADADATAVSALVQNITYENTDTNAPTTGQRTLRYVLTDGDGGSSGYDLKVIVAAANDAPVNTVPGAQNTNEDTNLVFSAGNGNQITITDPDSSGDAFEVTLSVTNGTLSLPGTAGLTFVSGDGTTDSSMTFRGTVTNINTALNGLTFIPTTDYNGGATLTLTTRDSQLVSLDIDANLQARYTFQGNADDVAPGTAQNGTLTNGAAITTDGTRGQVLSLDGANDFVDLSTHTTDFAGFTQGTISGWVKSTGTNETIFSISDTADTGSYAALFLGGSGYLTYEVVENGVMQLAVYKSDSAINDGNWHHVAVTIGPSGNTLYVDGVAATGGQLTYDTGNATTQHFFSSVSNLDSMAIGRNQDSSGGKWYTTGNLDDTRLYNRALTETDVVNLAMDLSLTDTDTVTISVNAQNDAPVLDNTGTMTLTNIAEDDTSSTGDTVAAIIASAGGNRITDVDTGAVEGMAVIGVDDTNGTWQYNTGSGWTAFGAVTNTTAVLLDSTATIRFVPDASYTGAAGDLTFRAWDTTTGSDGDTGVDVSTNGGTTAYSSATETATLTVTAVNDAPVLTPSTPSLTTITEDDTGNSGNLISAIVTTDIADIDSGAVEGMAITALNSSNGTWQYNTGSGWTDVGTVTNASALLLRETDSLRFVPDGQNADTASVTYRAWDQTSGAAGTKVDASTNGGTTAFSSATDTASITVTAVNDAPANTVPGAQTVNEDTALIFNTANGNLISISDADAGNNPLRITLTATNGTMTLSQTTGLAFNTGDGTTDATMVFEGTLANINAALDGLSFLGDQNFTGAANIQIITDDLTLTSLNEDTSLLGYYTFDNTGDLGNDDSPAGGHDGTITGAVTTNDATRGNVLSLDGNNDYVDITGAGALFGSPADITLSAWVNYSNADTLGGEVISLGNNVMLRVDNGARGVTGVFYDGTTWQYNDSSMSLADGNWHHIAFTFDDAGNTQALYIDGVLAASGNATESITYTQGANTRIGANSSDTDNDFDFNGLIDEARIYDRALTATEIANLALEAPSTDTDNIPITVNAVNDVPTITNLGGDALAYTEGDGAVVIDQSANATVADVDSSNFDTGTLTVSFTAGSDNAEDVLAIRNQGTGAGQIGVSGSNVTYEGTTIGSFTGGSGGTNLVITLDADADADAVSALVQNITYENTDTDNPTTGARTVRYVLTDGDGGTSVDYDTTVTVSGQNDAPIATNDPGNFNSEVTTLNPLSYWRFGETMGASATDEGSLGNNGTYNGVTLGEPGALNGDANTAVDFNGWSDYIEIAHDPGYLLNNGSVQLWFKADTIGDIETLFSKDSQDHDTGGHLDIHILANGEIQARLQSNVGDNLVTSTNTVTAGTWHHVVVTFGANGMTLHVDGALEDTNAYTGGLGATSGDSGNFEPIVIGASSRSSDDLMATPLTQFFGGLIDEVSIFGSQLSTESIQNFYATGIQAYPVSEDGTLTVNASAGVLRNDSDPDGDGLTVSLLAGPSNAAAFTLNADGSFTYTPVADFNGTDTFTYQVSDGNGGTDTATATILVTAVNDAPVLDNTGTMTLTNIAEDHTTSAGDTVAAIISSAGGNRITDVDTGAVEGMAVIGVDDTNGTWQYNTGSGWTAFGAVTNTTAVLLDSTATIRFVPDASYTGSAGDLTFRAWDTTTGTTGDTGVDVSTNGGTTAYSAATETATLTVTAVNDAPVLTPSTPSLTTITEDDTNNSGNLISAIVTTDIADVDSGAVEGMAITALNSSNGTWQYNTGSGWTDVGAVTNASALLLRATDSLRFVPDGQNADTASVTYRAWDQTSGAAGTKADVSTNGGTTAFSSATDTASITVTAVNDAPVLDNTGTMTLTNIAEDHTTSAGDTVAAVIVSAGGNRITDVDTSAVEGMAVIGVDDTNGTWQYNTGSGWTAFGAVTNTNAVLLDSTAALRFVPDASYTGSAGDLTFRAWDTTTGSDGDTGVDVSTNGGTTAYSAATETATLTVTAVNDAPVLTPSTPSLTTITEDDTNNSGNLISAIVTTDIADIDSGAVEGMAITALNSSNGTWQYNTGSGWTDVGTVTNASALLLRETDSLRFVPDGQNADTASVTYRAWDQTSGAAGTKVDVSTNGGTTAFSTVTDTASITVTAVNDAPVITSDGGGGTANSSVVEGNTAVTTVVATDVDVPADTLSYSLVGGSDQGFFSIDPNSGALTFQTAPAFASPADADMDNVYDVQVQVSDGKGGIDTQMIHVTVTDTNTAPTISSNGGGPTANLTVAEETTAVTTVTATDPDLPTNTLTYRLVGGADAARFHIDSQTGALTFTTPADFEQPLDGNSDNVYQVQVEVSDGQGGTDQQTLHVTVTNIIEAQAPLPDSSPEAEAEADSEADSEGPAKETLDSSSQAVSPPAASPNTVTPALLDERELQTEGETKSEGADNPELALSHSLNELESLQLTRLTSRNLLTLSEALSDTMRTVDFSSPLPGPSSDLSKQLDALAQHLQDTMQDKHETSEMITGVATGGGLTVSAGYIAWMLRGTSLLTSLLASFPAWGHFDPLPVLSGGYTARKTEMESNQSATDKEDQEYQGIDRIFRDTPQDEDRSV
ncbi:LamG-like jellyroll fold domain-containing protein [Nitrospira sp. M1]